MARLFVSVRRPCVVRAAFCAALAMLSTLPSSLQARTVTPRGPLTADELVTIDVFERAKRSVVYISTSQSVRDPWTRNVRSIPSGTPAAAPQVVDGSAEKAAA